MTDRDHTSESGAPYLPRTEEPDPAVGQLQRRLVPESHEDYPRVIVRLSDTR